LATVSTTKSWRSSYTVTTPTSPTYPACMSGTTSVTTASTTTILNQVTADGPVRDYQGLIRRGQSATSALSGHKRTAVWTPVKYNHRHKTLPCLRLDVVGTPAWVLPTLPSANAPNTAAEDDAARALTSSYLENMRGFSGGVAIAEFGDTLKLLQSPFKSLWNESWKLSRKLIRLKRAYPNWTSRMYARKLTNLWLAYQFGVRPLVNDIQEAHSALQHMASELGSRDTVPMSGSGVYVYDNLIQPNQSGIGGVTAVQTVTSRTEYSVRYKGAIRADPPGVGGLMQWFGLDIWDVPVSAYNYIPFSFLLDYITNTGDMIDGLRMCTKTVAWLLRGTRHTKIRTGSEYYPHHKNSQGYHLSVAGGSWYTTASRVTRRDVTSWPFPYQRWTFRTPGFASMAWMNIGALAASFVAGQPGPLRERNTPD